MLATYLASREALGAHGIPSGDPEADAEVLCEALGGRALAYVYAAQILAALEPDRPVDADGRPIDYDAIYDPAGAP